MVLDGPVLLVGLMGSGKTHVGKALACRLNVPYLDNDLLLAEQEGLDTVALAARGRDVLHRAESRYLHALAARSGKFVAGAAASIADREADCRLASSAFTVIYLDVPPRLLADRVVRDPARPWIDADPLSWIEQTFARRDAAFRAMAHLTTDNTDRADRVVDAILTLLGTSSSTPSSRT